MSQAEHWIRENRRLREEFGKYRVDQFNKLKKYFEDRKGKEDELVARIMERRDQADRLIEELESVLHFTDDDIRSSLAADTHVRICNALDKIKIYQYGPKKANSKKHHEQTPSRDVN